MNNLYYWTLILTYILLLFAVIFSILKYKIVSKIEKWYIHYILFLLFIESSNYILTEFLNFENTSFLYKIYIAGEFLIITTLFIKKMNLNKYLILISTCIGLYFLFADTIFSNYHYNNDYSKTISNILLICLIGYSLIGEIKHIKSKNTFQLIDKMYFLYFAVSIFIFIFQHQLLEFPINYFNVFWIINNLMVCIIYSLFIKTFLSFKK